MYLAFTPLSDIPEKERSRLAFEIVVAALIAPEEFIFGELAQQELLKSLDGSQYAWIKDFVVAFAEGKFSLYDDALAKHKAQFDAEFELKNVEATVLRPKMSALALLELAFRKPKKQRRLTFDEIATHCRVDVTQVERLIMRAMCVDLLKGMIDQVASVVIVTWVMPRILDAARIEVMRDRMSTWAEQTGLIVAELQDKTPELLMA
mmetsp:Transcript_98157/g.154715  ORF Transcript_98157/g.154715 Transcript_98157/m.154715 type:complete len:206 (+) Transcript_98157:1-618(+)